MTKRKIKIGYLISGGIALLIAVLLLFFAYRTMSDWKEFIKTAVETKATITEIKTKRTRTGTGRKRRTHVSHTVYAQYTVDGQTYNITLDHYNAAMRKGGTETIYYDPQHPDHAKSKPYVTIAVMCVFGFLIMILGSWLLKTEIGTHFYIKQLIAENRYVICDNWRDKKSNVSINNIRYHCTECTYSENGEDYVFTSDIYHPNLPPFANGDKVKVYVDLFNPKVYYVSFEKVTDNYY